MKTKFTLSLLSLIALLVVTGSVSARPLNAAVTGTAFTYQGKLSDGGTPANGKYVLECKLYDDLTGGVQQGSTIVADAQITNGLFTVQLDFGDVFYGTALFLQIGVRPNGSVGAFTLLTPRQQLTATPFALSASRVPWSGIYGMPAGFADGVDNGSYQNIKVVAQSGGDFTSIQAALDSITDASDTNRYLVYVAPGVYNEQVTMKSFVDIQGAGELATKITFAGSATATTGTLLGADNAELRFLKVENTGGNTYAIAIYNNSASPHLTNVTTSTSGGTSNYSVYNYSSSPTMTNVTAKATGGAESDGVYNNYSSSPIMANVTANASGGTSNTGVYNDSDSSPTMTNVIATASGGTNDYGMGNTFASATINNSVINASGGSTGNYGILNYGSFGSYTVLVNNSQISGSTNTITNATAFTTRVGASQLNGGAVAGGGTLTCAGVYDENYTFYASTCP